MAVPWPPFLFAATKIQSGNAHLSGVVPILGAPEHPAAAVVVVAFGVITRVGCGVKQVSVGRRDLTHVAARFFWLSLHLENGFG